MNYTKTALTFILLFTFATVSGCAGVQFKKEDLIFSFIEPTELNQKQNYDAVLISLAKKLNDSNSAIKVKDPEGGTILSRVAIECSSINASPLDPNRYTVLYNLEISTKDKKIKFDYEAVELTFVGFGPDPVNKAPFRYESQAKGARSCAELSKNEILADFTTAKKSKNW